MTEKGMPAVFSAGFSVVTSMLVGLLGVTVMRFEVPVMVPIAMMMAVDFNNLVNNEVVDMPRLKYNEDVPEGIPSSPM